MNRIVDQLPTSPIKQKPRIVKQDLIDYYKDISSIPGEEKIGIKCEKVGVDINTGLNISYYGQRGFLNILKRLVQELGWDVVARNGRNILELRRRDTRLTLESDGRIELSGHVHKSIHDLYREFFLHKYEISIISNIFNVTFGQFLSDGFKNFRPTLEDFILHESTIYTDVRIKKYIEIRCCDAVPPVLSPSFPALIKGLVYHPDGLDTIDRMTKGWDYNTVQDMRHRVAKNALHTRVNHVRLFDLARELLDIADKNLKDIKVYNIREEDESIYLHPLREFLIESKMCPARLIAENWETKWNRDIKKLIEFCSY